MTSSEKINAFDSKIQEISCEALQKLFSFAWDNKIFSTSVESNYKKNFEGIDFENFVSKVNISEKQLKLIKTKLLNGSKIVNVIKEFCNKCKSKGYVVTGQCQACTARYCSSSCKFDAVYFDENSKSHIDPSKCKSCSACSKACPYGAIISLKRPCQLACKVDAISAEQGEVVNIDEEKCVSCGACVRRCPFGAIVDSTFALNVIDMIKKGDNNKNYKVHALVAPSIVGQFSYAKLGQVVAAIKHLGFFKVHETAVGADMTAFFEAKELAETEKLLLSSCCPAFVSQVEKHHPNLKKYVSKTPTPMAMIGKLIKEKDKDAKCIFIGPCIAKKNEFRKSEIADFIDSVLTYEELEALFISRNINVTELDEEVLNGGTYFGRVFARSGGLSEAVVQGLKENEKSDFQVKSIACSGIEECKIALMKAKNDSFDSNFVEGMACVGGCVGGPACLNRKNKNKKDVDDHGSTSVVKFMKDSFDNFNKENFN
ncbi:MAG: monomeric [FeFe] hydrogenase [Clostridiales bacterium]|nr:monomeric [FeFe] hydrogenase [Clostridiales bacterium]